MILVTPFMDDPFLMTSMVHGLWIALISGNAKLDEVIAKEYKFYVRGRSSFQRKKHTFLKFWVDYIRIRHIFGLCLSPLKLKFFIWVIFPIRGDESQTMVNRILNQRKSCFSSKILFFHEIIILFSVKFIFNTFNVLLLILSKIQKNAFLNPGFRKLRKPEFFNMIPL